MDSGIAQERGERREERGERRRGEERRQEEERATWLHLGMSKQEGSNDIVPVVPVVLLSLPHILA